jgi:nucleoid DNA-binding protein
MKKKHITSDGLARLITSKHRLTLEESRQIVDQIFEKISDGLRNDVETWVVGFGKFCVQKKPSRMVVNPKTGKMFMGRPKTLPRVRWSSVLLREPGNGHNS